jgi:hypothetical protein
LYKVIVLADLANVAHVAIPLTDLAGKIDDIPMGAERHEIGDWIRHLWELDAQRSKTLIGRGYG